MMNFKVRESTNLNGKFEIEKLNFEFFRRLFCFRLDFQYILMMMMMMWTVEKRN